MKRLLTAILFLALGTNITFAQSYDRGMDAKIDKDFALALRNFRPLAKRGHADAQEQMGYLYKFGNGVLKDNKEAFKWFKKAARQGVSQVPMGLSYWYGEGVKQDYIKAHMWLNIASAKGHPNAGEYRNDVELSMTQSDISRATNMARECMASDYKKCGY